MQDAKKNPTQFYPGKNCVSYLKNFGLEVGFFVNLVPSKIFLFQIWKMDVIES